MAKSSTLKIRMNSTADTGFFYVTKKNPKNTTEKLVQKKIRPGRAQACRVQGRQDQIGSATRRLIEGRAKCAAFLLLRP